jgi:3-oxoacyl-[acyl-carrier-protein] synthase-3
MASGKLENVQIRGMAAAVPEKTRTLSDIEKIFGEDHARRISKSTGIVQTTICSEGMCASDLCSAAADRLLGELDWDRDSVDLLVFVSTTPDYITPPTAPLLQHRLNLSKSCASFDINLGCSGFVYGLWVVGQLLNGGNVRRALLLVGDTASRLASPYERTTAPLFGDAGTATAMERNDSAEPMYFEMLSDGARAEQVMTKAGGFRYRSTPQTRERNEKGNGNVRGDEDIYVNGSELFEFTLREVPAVKNKVLELAGWSFDAVDGVVMTHANVFVMRHLAEKMVIPKHKLVDNLANYGDTGACSIPLAMCLKLVDQLRSHPQRLILLGFGAGLSWGGVAMTLGPIVLPDLVKVPDLNPASLNSQS